MRNVQTSDVMEKFRGTMRLSGETQAVPVEARVDTARLVLAVDGTEVGAWALDQVTAERTGEGLALDLGTERVIIDVTERTEFFAYFEAEVEEPASRRVRREHRKPGRRKKEKRDKEPRDSRLSTPLVVLGVLFLGLVAVAILFPEVTGSILLLLGVILLVVGALAYTETRVALRLPLGLAPVHFVVAGGLVSILGVALILLG